MKVLLGMSGGVDSTCAALELAGEGHDVVGAVLVMHDHTDTAAARDAARSVGIPLIEVDCREAFSKTVESYFANEYLSGRTPNPCVVCNSEVKFRYLYERAMSDGFDAIATGHYAGVASDGGRYFVTEAEDPDKDQSYVLYRLPQSILSKLLLPLGKKRKKELLRRHRAVLETIYNADSSDDHMAAEVRYHGYIAECCGNSALTNLIPVINASISMAISTWDEDLKRQAAEQHTTLTNAICRQDTQGAKYAMIVHLNTSREYFIHRKAREQEGEA